MQITLDCCILKSIHYFCLFGQYIIKNKIICEIHLINNFCADANELPGPGSYTTRKKFSVNDSPAYKIGEKLKEKIGKHGEICCFKKTIFVLKQSQSLN